MPREKTLLESFILTTSKGSAEVTRCKLSVLGLWGTLWKILMLCLFQLTKGNNRGSYSFFLFILPPRPFPA